MTTHNADNDTSTGARTTEAEGGLVEIDGFPHRLPDDTAGLHTSEYGHKFVLKANGSLVAIAAYAEPVTAMDYIRWYDDFMDDAEVRIDGGRATVIRPYPGDKSPDMRRTAVIKLIKEMTDRGATVVDVDLEARGPIRVVFIAGGDS